MILHCFRSDVAPSTNEIVRKKLNKWIADKSVKGEKEEARSRILSAMESDASSLVLTSCSLNNLTGAIGRLSHLTHLYLVNNSLSSLPREFWLLTGLRALKLENNCFTLLPSEIGQLTALTSLNLLKNRLTSLPKEIGKLTNLSLLELSSNPLKALPAEIKLLTNLTALGLNSTHLSFLPSEIGKLTLLESLNLFNSRLESLPKEIGNLSNLTSLKIEGSFLQALPTEIGQLTSLATLSLGFNQLASLPTEIGLMTSLTSLVLYFNDITSLPTEIGQLTALTTLRLTRNRLTALPMSIGQLVNLTNLSIHRNGNLRELPFCLGHIAGLTQLDLDGTGIDTQIRDSILAECRLLRDTDTNADEILNMRMVKWGIERQFLPVTQRSILNEWLLRLEKTKDFALSQKALAHTVRSILEDVFKNQEFSEFFFIQAEANNACCQDRAAMALNEIYTSWMILCKSVDLKMLTGVAKTLCLRSELQKLIPNGERESVEIFLYYESTLRERLQLVTAIQNMKYGEIGRRDWIHEDALVKTVNENFFEHLLDLPVFEKLAKAALKREWEAIAQLEITERPEGDDLSEAVLSWSHEIGKVMQERKRAWAQCVKNWYGRVINEF